jgi:membrane-bound lytic murein transglycosylase MltF
MVSAGLVPATFVDSFMADLYTQVFPGLRKHPEVALSTGGEIGWAFRKESPRLAEVVNAFVRTHKQGSLAGNVVINKYLKTTRWVKNARSDEDMKRFRAMIDLFRKYSDRYEFDYLLMAAQGYQESHLDQSKRSHVGAIGVMQVMPATARDKAIGIPDIENLESNIHAGIKYNRWVADNFYNDPTINPVNRQLFAFASYNAGPGRVSRLRKEAAASGLAPNRWFNNVELVAAKRIGRETVQYVSNIYKYYLAYQMVQQQSEARQEAKAAAPSTASTPRTRSRGGCAWVSSSARTRRSAFSSTSSRRSSRSGAPRRSSWATRASTTTMATTPTTSVTAMPRPDPTSSSASGPPSTARSR